MNTPIIKTFQDEQGFLAIMLIGEDGKVYVRYINPYVNDQNCEVPEENVDALLIKVKSSITNHNSKVKSHLKIWSLEMY